MMMTRAAAMTTPAKARNHGARKRCLNSLMVETDCSGGAFNWRYERVSDHGVLARSATHCNHDRASDTLEASYPAKERKFLFQEDGGEDSTDDDGEGTQGRDDNSFDERVGSKVAQFTDNHHGHAQPPHRLYGSSRKLSGVARFEDAAN